MSVRLVPLAAVAVAGIASAALMGGDDRLLNIGHDVKVVASPGETVTRNLKVASFDRIEVAGPYEVTVAETGTPGAIEATGGSNLLDNTDIVVEDGVLKIRPHKENGLNLRLHNSGKATITLAAANLKGAEIAGSGRASIAHVAGPFTGSVAGSGQLELERVVGGELALEIAGSGDIRAGGEVDSIKTEIAGSGDMDLAGLHAKTANIEIAGSGGVRADVSDKAAISVMGSGDVAISGGAKCSIEKAGSGNVQC